MFIMGGPPTDRAGAENQSHIAAPWLLQVMLSYSPVDNIKPAAYPNVLVTAGLHDPRVGELRRRRAAQRAALAEALVSEVAGHG